MLVTCRTANFEMNHIPWKEQVIFELAPLERSEIGKLIGRWYGGGNERGQRLRDVVMRSYNLFEDRQNAINGK